VLADSRVADNRRHRDARPKPQPSVDGHDLRTQIADAFRIDHDTWSEMAASEPDDQICAASQQIRLRFRISERGNRLIESGRPQWGVDIDDSTLPQEANFDELGAISYTKGCYIGQETVARVHFRGHVNRFLRRLRFVTRPAPPKGAELVDDTGKVIGEIRSAALSPRFGGVALGMVRREVPPGTTLQARWAEGECSVQVEQNEKGATV